MPEPTLGAPSRMWRWILILGPVLVVALAYQSLWTLRAAERPDSADMSVETDRVARLIDAYIARVVGVTAHLAIAPDIVRLAEASTTRSVTGADEAVQTHWSESANAAGDPFNAIRSQSVSQFFADVKAADKAYREIFLADLKGRLIAASNRTEDFQQNDDSWWPKDLDKVKPSCRRNPMDCVSLSSVEWDPSAGLFGYDVVLPVVNSNGQPVGVLKAVVDPSELDGLLKFAALSRELDVTLINAKGVQIFSRELFLKNPKALPCLRHLLPGNEGSWPLAGSCQDATAESRRKEPVAFVRRLSSPVAGGWFVAITGQDDGGGAWMTYALWCLFTLGMFLIAAGAFAVRVPAGTEGSEEREA